MIPLLTKKNGDFLPLLVSSLWQNRTLGHMVFFPVTEHWATWCSSLWQNTGPHGVLPCDRTEHWATLCSGPAEEECWARAGFVLHVFPSLVPFSLWCMIHVPLNQLSETFMLLVCSPSITGLRCFTRYFLFSFFFLSAVAEQGASILPSIPRSLSLSPSFYPSHTLLCSLSCALAPPALCLMSCSWSRPALSSPRPCVFLI